MRQQSLIGTVLAALIFGSWLVLHIYSVFFVDLSGPGRWPAPVLVLTLCWLNVGLFIVAHDAMHGSLAPAAPRLNHWLGGCALIFYAGFRIDRLKPLHLAHHAHPGTANDPDFSLEHPTRFWPWYVIFIRRYFGWRQFLVLCVPVALYLAIGARFRNLLLFWALPAALSSLQLFYFGTYLPHRHDGAPFVDKHHARTSAFGWLLSLMTCFHFGYHHEHHLAPGVPWWRLPSERRFRRLAQGDRQLG